MSEAMHHLNVPTTRALSLVASSTEYTPRAWYRKEEDASRPQHDHPPNVMQHERCAITTRVAPSFIRVGHFELFARRARKWVSGSHSS